MNRSAAASPAAGSPAHAGIDRIYDPAPVVQVWFPRTRGDRPDGENDNARQDEVPPHTRG